MAWPKPDQTKSQVRKAGKRLAVGNFLTYQKKLDLDFTNFIDDLQTLRNWRSAHGAVLNTAQAWLRRLVQNEPPIIGQRLKRENTILDKLRTNRARDLSTMQDIAGVRAIFRSEEDIRNFQARALKSKAKHKLIHDNEKFDYIKNPKSTGYRGVHQIYSRHVPTVSSEPWNGLNFEVQLRTTTQHAWATAVEIYDSLHNSRFKFEKSKDPAYHHFLLISEAFARVFESRNCCHSHLSNLELALELTEMEKQTQLNKTLLDLSITQVRGELKKNSILARKKTGELVIHEFASFPQALKEISDIEGNSEIINAVLVGATTPQHIREAFRNYFDDTQLFSERYVIALEELVSKPEI